MKRFLIMCLLVCLGYTGLIAQSKKTDLSAQLSVGERVTATGEMPVLNWMKSEIDLEEYQDRVVVLEFFDTYCATCIEGMPLLQQVQQQMGDKLLVLMVTWQVKEVVEKFYKNNRFLKEKQVKLPTIVGDTLLRKYFPHQGVPHTVFLYRGKVQGVTYPDYVKTRFIEELYNTGKLSVPQKNDFRGETALLEDEENDLIGSVKLMGYQESLEQKPGLTIERDSLSDVYRTYFYNVGILNAYRALFAYIKKPTFMLTEQRVVWKVKDPSKYHYLEGSGGQQLWLTEHGISYERKSKSVGELSDQARLVLNDLNNLLGLNVYWDNAEMDCLVVREIEKSEKPRPFIEDGQKLENLGILVFLMDYSGKYPPVVDETKFTGELELGSYATIEELNEQLAYYGVEVVSGRRSIEVLVVEEL